MLILLGHLLNAFQLPEKLIEVGGHMLRQMIEYRREIEQLAMAIIQIAQIPEPFVPEMLDLLEKMKELEERMKEVVKTTDSQSQNDTTLDEDTRKNMSLMIRKIRECVANPTEQSIGGVRQAYGENEKLTKNIMSQIRCYSKERMFILMKKDSWRQKSTFDWYKSALEGYYAKAIFIDVFVSKLMNTKNNQELIDNALFLSEKQCPSWERTLREDQTYWDKMEENLKAFQLQCQVAKENEPEESVEHEVGLEEMADQLQEMFDGVLTNDAFYLIMFHTAKSDKELKMLKLSHPKQLLECYETDNSSIVIYRSKLANRVRTSYIEQVQNVAGRKEEQDEEELERVMNDARLDFFTFQTNEKLNGCGVEVKIRVENSLMNRQNEAMTKLENIGFVASFIGSEIQIRHANYTRSEGGPGWMSVKTGVLLGAPIQMASVYGYL